MKSGNLNFLEPSGPLQACNGTALPQLEDLGVDMKIILKWMYCTRSGNGGGARTGLILLRIRTDGGLL